MTRRQSVWQRIAQGALGAIGLLVAIAAPAQNTTVVEFYNRALDHYFITTSVAEIAALDAGVHPGWQRTGYNFGSLPPTYVGPGVQSVCRFYGNPLKGLDSHFYTADPLECLQVPIKFPDSWFLETKDAFRAMALQSDGTCAPGLQPIFRLYNNRPDVNHRYSDQVGVYNQMVAQEWIPEGNGDGPRPVIFCMPPVDPNPYAPVCSLEASRESPPVGTGIILTATCSNSPNRFVWIGQACNSLHSTCLVGAPGPGPVLYTMQAINADGAGPVAQTTVTWVAGSSGGGGGPGTLPQCTLNPSSVAPNTGSTLNLTLACTTPATAAMWLACDATGAACASLPCSGDSCAVSRTAPGKAYYAADARNATSVLRVFTEVTWAKAPAAPTCYLTASNPSPGIGANVTLTANCTDAPTSYAWVGCAGNLSSCVVTSAVPGIQNYSMTASNALGDGNVATIALNWTQAVPPGVPVCTLTASENAPLAGSGVTLTAACTETPLTYAWSNCPSGTGSTCEVLSATSGPVNYSVVASNANGSGPPASTLVNWQGAPGSPVCTMTTSNATPPPGTDVMLAAHCTNTPTSYVWTNCTSAYAGCVASSATAGAQTYSVVASNAVGSASASVAVNWTPLATPVCTLQATADTLQVGEPLTLGAVCTGPVTSYAWTGCDALSSTSSSCKLSTFTPGVATYSVVATNVNVSSAPASVSVSWTPVPQAPVCTLKANATSLWIGQSVLLTASCTGGVTLTYKWTGCSNVVDGHTCIATETTVGRRIYAVAGTNMYGQGLPASVVVDWTDPTADAGTVAPRR